MRKFGKIVIFMLMLAMATSQYCFADVSRIDNSITLSYDLGEDNADKALAVTVFAPNKDIEDLETMTENFKDTVIFSKPAKSNEDGMYKETFNFNYEDAVSGMYMVVISGEGILETEKFLYTNKKKTAIALEGISDNATDVDKVAEILESSSYDLGVDDKYFDDDVAVVAAKIIVDYLEKNTITENNASDIINKAVAIVALGKGEIDNIISEAEIFDLKTSSIKDFYKEDYVIASVGRDMTDRISEKNIQSFEDFDAALLEGFVLAVVKNPNGSDNTKSVMKAFAEEIGISKNGKTAQYEYVSNKDFDSYGDLKRAFENAPSTNVGGGGNGGTGGGGGGGFSNKVSNITYYDDTEKETHTPYPITIFDDLRDVSWAEDAIIYLAEKQIINGKGNYKFAPNDEITREEFLKIVLNAFELTSEEVTGNTFKDVKNGSWYEEYVNTAYSLGIIKGYSEEIFGVGEKITRQDMAVIIDRAAQKAEIVFGEVNEGALFEDDNAISDYAKQSVYLLKNADVINGMGDGTFAPMQNATRAQAALMIYNVVSK